MSEAPRRERLLELLADRALFGIEVDEDQELQTLLQDFPDVDADGYDRVAAQLEVAALGAGATSMPAELEDRIRQTIPTGNEQLTPDSPLAVPKWANSASATSSDRSCAQQNTLVPRHDDERVGKASGLRMLLGVSGWVTAATLFVALAFPQFIFGPPVPEAATPTLAQLRDELVASSPSLINRQWTATEDESAEGASGSVAWDNESQQGFMTFRGLAVNNPSEYQYQLWIFDEGQEHPVDGGVFDITDRDVELVIPIDAKLKVAKPTLFAVTIEKPGGVVVSKKERIAVLAPPPEE